MRLVVAALFASLAVGAAAPAAELPADSGLARRLVALERSTWRLYRDKDAAALRRLAAPDFADLYLDGTVVNRERWLADMRGVDVLGSELTRFHVFRADRATYLVTYEARARGRAGATLVETHVGVTSAWVRRGGRWTNTFYEENPLEPVRRSTVP